MTDYRLPFGNDPAWHLSNGNWDDPVSGHSFGYPFGLQAFAFDFVHPEGGEILAARAGTVYALVASESGNSWGSKDPCNPGVGNYLVIKHGDGTFGVYWHMKQNGVLVALGASVARGGLIALSGNTGNSSAPHLHFDVRSGWDLSYRCDNLSEFPSVMIHFEDKNHKCWRPRVGDVLASNNA
jgi:murein DD-endopeptidase MepM/ murein hydrolase activator NlpD